MTSDASQLASRALAAEVKKKVRERGLMLWLDVEENYTAHADALPAGALAFTYPAKCLAAESKTLQHFATLRETLGAASVVEIDLGLDGREIDNEDERDELIADLRERIVHELAAKHRVHLRRK